MRAGWLFVCGLCLMLGCGDNSSVPNQPSSSRSAPPPPPPPIGQQVADAVGQQTQPPAKTQQIKAQAGVAKQGRSLDDPNMNALIVGPARAYFSARERIVFEVQVPKALQMYKALHGAAPKNHQEFMEQVIQANRIPLPKLPAGSRYIYSPQDEQLMVERPAPNNR